MAISGTGTCAGTCAGAAAGPGGRSGRRARRSCGGCRRARAGRERQNDPRPPPPCGDLRRAPLAGLALTGSSPHWPKAATNGVRSRRRWTSPPAPGLMSGRHGTPRKDPPRERIRRLPDLRMTAGHLSPGLVRPPLAGALGLGRYVLDRNNRRRAGVRFRVTVWSAVAGLAVLTELRALVPGLAALLGRAVLPTRIVLTRASGSSPAAPPRSPSCAGWSAWR